jgi:hypothetical protein
VSLRVGLGIAVLSVAVSILSDLAAGIPALRFWNAGMAFVSYALFAGVLAELRPLVGELDRRVQERTAALQREGVERQRLDQVRPVGLAEPLRISGTPVLFSYRPPRFEVEARSC